MVRLAWFILKTGWLWERCQVVHTLAPCPVLVSHLSQVMPWVEDLLRNLPSLLFFFFPWKFGGALYSGRWRRDWQAKWYFSNWAAYQHHLEPSKTDVWVPLPEILISLSGVWPGHQDILRLLRICEQAAMIQKPRARAVFPLSLPAPKTKHKS